MKKSIIRSRRKKSDWDDGVDFKGELRGGGSALESSKSGPSGFIKALRFTDDGLQSVQPLVSAKNDGWINPKTELHLLINHGIQNSIEQCRQSTSSSVRSLAGSPVLDGSFCTREKACSSGPSLFNLTIAWDWVALKVGKVNRRRTT